MIYLRGSPFAVANYYGSFERKLQTYLRIFGLFASLPYLTINFAINPWPRILARFKRHSSTRALNLTSPIFSVNAPITMFAVLLFTDVVISEYFDTIPIQLLTKTIFDYLKSFNRDLINIITA